MPGINSESRSIEAKLRTMSGLGLKKIKKRKSRLSLPEYFYQKYINSFVIYNVRRD